MAFRERYVGVPDTITKGDVLQYDVASDTFVPTKRIFNQVIATASLPAGDAAMDGVILVEDAGGGTVNVVFYGGGRRFRVTGVSF